MTEYLREYLRSARFACGSLTLLMGLAFLIGGLVLLGYGVTDLRYYIVVGAALCAIGIALAVLGALGLALYGLLSAAALAWTLYRFGLDLWQLPPHLLALLFLGAILFALRDRILRRSPRLGPVVRTGPPPH